MSDSAPDDHEPVVILPHTDTAEPISVRAHLRGNKMTITIPDEILAMADLINKPAADIVAALLVAQVSEIRSKAITALWETI